MARVVVVGAGLAGVSAAVRLAKLGHGVMLLEADDAIGGQLRPLVVDGHAFDRWPPTTTLPGALRDLFRKSGRPLDRVLDLQHVAPGRRHLLPGGVVLDLPMGRRGDQLDAVETALPGRGGAWTSWLDGQRPAWEALRRTALDDRPTAGLRFDRDAAAALHPRRSLRRGVRRAFRDDALRRLALDRFRADGDDPRAVPAFVTVAHLVERTFGRWQVDGGTPALLDALATRLRERRVDVRSGARADAVVRDGGRVVGVEVAGVLEPADLVVWAAPEPAESVRDVGVPRMPAARTLLRVSAGTPALPAEVLAHTDVPVRIWAAGSGDAAARCWTLEHRTHGEDVLLALARVGLDLRDRVEHRVDLSPVDQVRARGAAAEGWLWSGWRSALDRPGAGPEDPGLLSVGVDAHPGPSLPLVLMGTAAAAESVGRA